MSVPYHTRADSKPFSYSVRSRSSSLNRRHDESPEGSSSNGGLSSMGLASPSLIRKMLGEASSSGGAVSAPEGSFNNDDDIFNESGLPQEETSEESYREVPIQKSPLDFYELSQDKSRDNFTFDMKRSSFDNFVSKTKSPPPLSEDFSKKTTSPEDIYATTTKMKDSKKVPDRSLYLNKSLSEDSYTKKSSILSDLYSSPTKSPNDSLTMNPFEDFDAKNNSVGGRGSFASKIGSETYHIPIKLERNLDGFESPSAPTSSLTDVLLNKSNDESWLEKQLQKLKERKGVISSSSSPSYLTSSTTTTNKSPPPLNGHPTSLPSNNTSSTYIPISQFGRSATATYEELDRSRVTSDSEERGMRVPIMREDKHSEQQHSTLERQRSESYGDRSRSASGIRRQRIDSDSSDVGASLDTSTLHQKLMAASLENGSSSRPITPAFPPGTPYNNRSRANTRAPSPCYSQRRGSIGSLASSDVSASEESATNVKLVKDNFKYWYKPSITREEAIALLKHRPAGTFIVRDSHSFPGAYGLALKVSKPPPPSGKPKPPHADPLDELVRHFLIEPTTKGVRLKGYSNEPIFASLSSLVYQHSLTALALPAKLVLPQADLDSGSDGNRGGQLNKMDSMRRLFDSGAACNVSYLFTMETDALTGSVAVDKTVSTFLELTKDIDNNPGLVVVDVHFKVTTQGITVTDNERKLFFRKHYNISTIGHCGLDPQGRTYVKGSPATQIFAFVAKKHGSRTHNQCHLFAAVDPEQPAVAIVNFVNRVLSMTNPKRIEVV